MIKVEDLQGIHGTFEGSLRQHPNPKLELRFLADGEIVYERRVDGEARETIIPVRSIRVRRLSGPGIEDLRRYVRVRKGPKEDRDKIIALID